MQDLISRQAAIDAINQICPIDTEYDCTLLDRVDVRCVLEQLPSAQPEIVRCKDCKFSSPNGQYGCRLMSDDASRIKGLYADGFCSFGERKEDDE